MGSMIRACEWLSTHLLAVAAGLRSFRDGPGDEHSRFHCEIARIALQTERCPGGDLCVAGIILDAMERRTRKREKPPIARGNA